MEDVKTNQSQLLQSLLLFISVCKEYQKYTFYNKKNNSNSDYPDWITVAEFCLFTCVAQVALSHCYTISLYSSVKLETKFYGELFCASIISQYFFNIIASAVNPKQLKN